MTNLLLNDWSGGIRYNGLNQTNKRTSWADAYNIELKSTHDGYGFAKMKGNQNILNSILPENTKILGLFEYIKGDNKYLVVNTSEGCFYELDTESGLLSEPLKFGLSPTAKCSYVNFQDGVIVSNGIDDPFFYEHNMPVRQCNASRSNIPIRSQAIAQFNNRLFIGVGGTLFYSALGRYDDWTTQDDAGYIADFHNSSASILALEKYGEFLAIHKEGFTFLLTGSSPLDFSICPFTDKGSCSSFGVINAEGKQFFYNEGIYFLEYNSLLQYKLSDEITPHIKPDLSNIDRTKIRNIFAIHYPKKCQVWVYMQYLNLAEKSVCWIYDLISHCWYKRIQQDITYACLFDGDIYTGTVDGKILKEDMTETFDGQPIEFCFSTPYFNFGMASKQKTLEELNIIFDYSCINKFQLSYRYNDDDRIQDIEYIDELDTTTMIWDDDIQGLWDVNYYAISIFSPVTFYPAGTFRSLQLNFQGTGIDEGCSVKSIEFLNIEMDE
jgi:hypothetical protein